jgi:hypothetical protein
MTDHHKLDRAAIYDANAEEVPDPSPAPQGDLITVRNPNRERSAAELRRELAEAERAEAARAEAAAAEQRERERVARAVDAAAREAEVALDDVLRRFRALLPGAETMAAEVRAAEARCLEAAYRLGALPIQGAAQHRLNAHPIQRLRALLDVLSERG